MKTKVCQNEEREEKDFIMKNWFLSLFKKSQSKVLAGSEKCAEKTAQEHKDVEEQTVSSPELKIVITTEHRYEENEQLSELSHLDFGKPAGELGCFLNYEPRVLCPPTEKQINYLKDLGVFIPDGITKEDASCMISRATGEDSEESPRPEIVALASGFKLEFSAFIGNSGLFRYVINGTSKRDRAALYAYAVRQSMRGGSFGNMLEDPDLEVFYAFADQVITDSSLMRSLLDRTADDYKKPYRGTAIYKAAAAYLATGTISK